MMAWNPERAPQAMVIKRKGKRGPGTFGPAVHERRHGVHQDDAPNDNNRYGQSNYGADLKAAGKIVRGAQKKPYGKDGSYKRVGRNNPQEGLPIKVEYGGKPWMLHNRRPRQGEDQYKKNRKEGRGPREPPHLRLGYAGDPPGLVPRGGEQNDGVVDRPREDASSYYPQHSRHEPELDGQDRPQEGPGRRNARDMAPEDHHPASLHAVYPVLAHGGRGGPVPPEAQYHPRQEDPVEPVAYGENAQGCENQGEGVHAPKPFHLRKLRQRKKGFGKDKRKKTTEKTKT